MEAPFVNGLFRHQRNFRILLQAMSRPGRLRRLEAYEHPAPSQALAECLLDAEVGFWVGGGQAGAVHRTAIAGETGAREVALEEADFAFFFEEPQPAVLNAIKRGRPESPESAATLVLSLEALAVEPAGRLQVRLTGPGIAEPEGIAPEMPGLSHGFLRAFAAVNADYPLGVDGIFMRPNGEIMCLPRSTRIRVK